MDFMTGLVVFISLVDWQNSFILQSKTSSDFVFISDYDACYVNGNKLNLETPGCLASAVGKANVKYPEVKFFELDRPKKFSAWANLPPERRNVVVYFQSGESCDTGACSVAGVMLFNKGDGHVVMRSVGKNSFVIGENLVKLRKTRVGEKNTALRKKSTEILIVNELEPVIKSLNNGPVLSVLLGASSRELYLKSNLMSNTIFR